MAVLSVSNLQIGYLKSILPPISFKVYQGELISVIGVNGIGKSTLIKSIVGIIPVLGGEVEILGSCIRRIAPHLLARHISLVLTESISSKSLTVEEVVAFGRFPYTNRIGYLSPLDIKAIESAMIQTSVIELRDKRCDEISDGQLQCTMIARALAQDTPIIILDEPTSFLDIYHRAQILKLLQKIAKQTGKTILMSSHEIEICLQISKKVLLMTPEKLFFDSPERMISSKVLTKIFPKGIVYFDSKSKRFMLNP